MKAGIRNEIKIVDEEEIDLREIFMKLFHHWRWFLISVVIFSLITAFYLRRTTPEYSVSATILIKDAKKGVGDAMSEIAAFQDLSMFSNSLNSLENEIEILKSRSLLSKVIKELNLNIQYLVEGRIKRGEYYNNSPVSLKFIDGDSIKYTTNASFKLNIISNSEYSIENDEFGFIGIFSFEEQIETPFGRLVFNSRFSETPKNTEVHIKVTPLKTMANDYSKKIKVTPLNNQTSVITISLVDPLKYRAKDFISTLIGRYNSDGVDEKNQVSKNTAEFIDKRLELIKEELNIVESSVATYKQLNEFTETSTEADLFLASMANTNQKVLELNTSLRMIEFMIDYLDKNRNEIKLLPTNIGLTDVSINNSVISYNLLVLERNKLLKNSSIQNPVIQSLDTQLSDFKDALLTSLRNLKQGVKYNLTSLNQEVERNNYRISNAPKQEKEFRGIKRQQEIKEALYLYLLQKREETAITLAVTIANAKLVDSAYINPTPVKPKKLIICLGALVLGLIFPVLLIYTKEVLDVKIHSRKDVENLIDVPIMGEIPFGTDESHLVINQNKRSNVAEAFRLVRTNLDFLLNSVTGSGAKVIGVTSTTAGEGKSFVSINLASTLALSGKKVLLVGMDLRKPKLLEYFNIKSQGKGITHFLSDKNISFEDLIHKMPSDQENLDLIESGLIPPNPAELLLNPRVSKLFEGVRKMYDYIVVDTAPVNLVTDTLLVNNYMDMFIYVTRANYLDKRLLSVPNILHSEERLKNMAILINGVDLKRGYGYGYGYGGYGYGYVYGEYGNERNKNKWKFWA